MLNINDLMKNYTYIAFTANQILSSSGGIYIEDPC